ncbi:hypothetical protein FSOLCH5_013673 [Fusarium solani]
MERDSDTQTTSKQAIKVHMKTWIVVTCVNFAYFSQLTAVIGSGFLAQSIAQLLGGASQTMWFNQSINLLGIAICLPVSQMADYWGRRWVLIVLLAIGFAGTMVVARAQNVATVIAGAIRGPPSEPTLYCPVDHQYVIQHWWDPQSGHGRIAASI